MQTNENQKDCKSSETKTQEILEPFIASATIDYTLIFYLSGQRSSSADEQCNKVL